MRMILLLISRVLIAFLCVVNIGCSGTTKSGNVVSCSGEEVEKSLKKSFDIANRNIIPSESYMFTNQDAEYIVFSDVSERFLYVFDFETGNVKHKIDVQSAVGKSDNYYNSAMLNGLYFSGFDSIFLLYNPYNTIYLINAEGELINSWTVSSTRSSGVDMSLYTYFSVAPLLFEDNRLFVFQQSNSAEYSISKNERQNIFDSGFEACIQLEKDTAYVVKETGFYPHSFLDAYYYEDTPSRVRNFKNESVISFGFSDSIYVLSEKDTLRIEAKSGHSREFRPFDPKEEANMTYIEEYFVEETRCYRIIYDGCRDLYYRVVLHGIPYRNRDGTKNLYQDKPFSILVLNENFQTLCEYSFPAKTYDFRNMVVSNEGLWISTGNDLNPTSPQNALEYELFQIDID